MEVGLYTKQYLSRIHFVSWPGRQAEIYQGPCSNKTFLGSSFKNSTTSVLVLTESFKVLACHGSQACLGLGSNLQNLQHFRLAGVQGELCGQSLHQTPSPLYNIVQYYTPGVGVLEHRTTL